MSKLGQIQSTVQQVAEAVSAALGVETEIVDDELTIVAGTGKYSARVGSKDEEAFTEGEFLYSKVLRTGQPHVVEDPANDMGYDPSSLRGDTEECGEICVPVVQGGRVIGVMALVAFDATQRAALLGKKTQLLTFLNRMAELLASKVSEREMLDQLCAISSHLLTIIDTIHEAVLSVDADGIISHFNKKAEMLTGMNREAVIGKPLAFIWPDSPIQDVLRTGKGYTEKEEIYPAPSGRMHFLVSARPIRAGSKLLGVVVSFRDIADIRRLVYDISQKSQASSFSDIHGISPAIQKLKEQAERVARANSTVLITGESGTGKELFARAIHFASPRAGGPFVTVNCGAIPETLLESELFGYDAGAFTGARKEGKPGKFELADGGTIFLDEIGDLPLHLQVKLLHVLQRKQVERIGSTRVIPIDVRVIAATNRDLESMIKDGEFRSDLYFRLSVIPLHIAPLRDRREDLEVLIPFFLQKYNSLAGKALEGLSSAVWDVFLNYDWPGNVRELENAMEYAVNMETGPVITVDSVPPRIKKTAFVTKEEGMSLRRRIYLFEKQIFEESLKRFGYTKEGKEAAARSLQISRATLYRKLKELNIRESVQDLR